MNSPSTQIPIRIDPEAHIQHPKRMANAIATLKRQVRVPRHQLSLCIAIACLTINSRAWQTPTPPPDSELTNETAIQRIDAAVQARTDGVAGYSVQELYSIYRNGETKPSAQVTVNTTYARGTGKDYAPISQTGSSILRSLIIDKVIANEKEMAKAANRESVSVTSANYQMQLRPEKATMNGRDCILMDIKAKRKTSYLFNGKAWFDASDFTLVHLEGSPAQSVSMFAGDTVGTRDYGKIDGFSMATHAQVHTHSFLFGNTVLKIDYTNYQIQHSQPTN